MPNETLRWQNSNSYTGNSPPETFQHYIQQYFAVHVIWFPVGCVVLYLPVVLSLKELSQQRKKKINPEYFEKNKTPLLGKPPAFLVLLD